MPVSNIQELWPDKGRIKENYTTEWVFLHIINPKKNYIRCLRRTLVKQLLEYREITESEEEITDLTYLTQGKHPDDFSQFFGTGCFFYLSSRDETNFEVFGSKSKK